MIRNALAAAACVAVLGAAGACANEETSPGAATVTSATMPPAAQTAQPGEPSQHPLTGASTAASYSTYCPMTVAGTTVVAVDTAVGENLVFKTNGDVPELRRRVYGMASYISMKRPGATPGRVMTLMVDMPQVHAYARDVDGGVQLELIPADPTYLDQTRLRAREGAQDMMLQRDCPMTTQ